jgi:hypothetical protein
MEKDVEAMKSLELKIGMLEEELNVKGDGWKTFATNYSSTKENPTGKCRTKNGHYEIWQRQGLHIITIMNSTLSW